MQEANTEEHISGREGKGGEEFRQQASACFLFGFESFASNTYRNTLPRPPVVCSLHVMLSRIEVSQLIWLHSGTHFPIHTGMKQVWEVRFLFTLIK